MESVYWLLTCFVITRTQRWTLTVTFNSAWVSSWWNRETAIDEICMQLYSERLKTERIGKLFKQPKQDRIYSVGSSYRPGPVLGHFLFSVYFSRHKWIWIKKQLFPKVAWFRSAEFCFVLSSFSVSTSGWPEGRWIWFTATRITWYNSSLYFVRLESPNEPILGIKNREW